MNDDGLYAIGEGEGVPHGASGLEVLHVEAEGARYHGVIIIEWPAAHGASPYSSIVGSMIKVSDALTGKLIPTVTRFTVRADAGELVTADVTMFADADGGPLLDGEPVLDGKEIRTGVFPFFVAEMRVAER